MRVLSPSTHKQLMWEKGASNSEEIALGEVGCRVLEAKKAKGSRECSPVLLPVHPSILPPGHHDALGWGQCRRHHSSQVWQVLEAPILGMVGMKEGHVSL